MVARLTLDTGVLIAAERGRLDLAAVVMPDDDVTVPAIVVAEYRAGTYLADTDSRRATRREFLDRVLRIVPVEDYTDQVAEHHAALLAHVRRLGRPHGAHDLIIAASGRSAGRTIVTTGGRAHLGELPDVSVQVAQPKRSRGASTS